MTTAKQKLVASIMQETAGNVSKAMKLAGYSAASAKDPQRLTRSKGWQELMRKYLPDDKLLVKHEEALEAMKVTSHGESDHEVPDHTTRLKAVDLAYKLKSKYLIEKSGGDTNIAVVKIVRFGEEKKEVVEAEVVK